MKVIRTYIKDADISYKFPSTNKQWSVQLAGNIGSVSFVGQNNDDTGDLIYDMPVTHTDLSCLDSCCFNKAVNISDIKLSPNIKEIKERCFNECTNIKTVSYDIYEAYTPGMTKTPALVHIGNYAFSKCGNMQSLTLPESINDIAAIDPLAFAESNLTSVTFLGITSDKLLGIQPR